MLPDEKLSIPFFARLRQKGIEKVLENFFQISMLQIFGGFFWLSFCFIIDWRPFSEAVLLIHSIQKFSSNMNLQLAQSLFGHCIYSSCKLSAALQSGMPIHKNILKLS
jgi:hypothetical protein